MAQSLLKATGLQDKKAAFFTPLVDAILQTEYLHLSIILLKVCIESSSARALVEQLLESDNGLSNLLNGPEIRYSQEGGSAGVNNERSREVPTGKDVGILSTPDGTSGIVLQQEMTNIPALQQPTKIWKLTPNAALIPASVPLLMLS